MGRVDVITVGPDTTGFNPTPHSVRQIAVAGPDAGAEPKLSLVGYFQRFCLIFEGRDADDRAKISSWKLRISLRPLIRVG